jgi:hypothetical protein
MMLNIFWRIPPSSTTLLEVAMLDFIGTVATVTMIVFLVSTVVLAMEAPRSAKLAVAALAGLWAGLCTAAGAAGWLAATKPFPIIGLFVAAPLIAAAIAAGFPAARQAMLSIPTPLIVGINIPRVLGVMFLLLAAQGRLAGPFPYSAGWGDIITGAAALPLLLTGTTSTALITAWNIFGLADLVLAIGLGVTSGQGSPLQVFHDAPGSAAMQHLPWAFVPTVLVPIWIILHGIVFAQLRHRADLRAVSPSVRAPG